MRVSRSLQVLRAACRPSISRVHNQPLISRVPAYKQFHASSIAQKTQTHVLSDIGEGVKEVQIIQWFVEEGAAVEEWAPLCEVQSDKASVEITSKYTGVIKRLHFDRDAIVQVGDAMLDIEVEGEDGNEESVEQEQEDTKMDAIARGEQSAESGDQTPPETYGGGAATEVKPGPSEGRRPTEKKTSGKHASIATPAVRGLLKEHGLEITNIEGSGKDGRVLKEDIYKHLENDSIKSQPQSISNTHKADLDTKQSETPQNLTAIQSAMLKSMTKSLSIPHFLFSDSINVSSLSNMRTRLNSSRNPDAVPKLSYMPFIIKAVSLALNHYPILNARLDVDTDAKKPRLIMRTNHNIGVAMDTPAGLLVPVIKNVNARSIASIAQELQRLSKLGSAGKLSSQDLSGGTITVSNIGNIGGETVAPVVIEGQLAIMGIGKIKPTPVFAADNKTVERADMMHTSWSADHRVIDGATMARAANLIHGYLEQPESMIVDMS